MLQWVALPRCWTAPSQLLHYARRLKDPSKHIMFKQLRIRGVGWRCERSALAQWRKATSMSPRWLHDAQVLLSMQRVSLVHLDKDADFAAVPGAFQAGVRRA